MEVWMTRRLPGFLLAGLLVFLVSLPLAARQSDGSGASRRGRFSIVGTVRDPQTNAALGDVSVELRQFNGPSVAQVFTTEDGGFIFANLPSDTYYLVVECAGYERIDQEISLNSNVSGIQLEPHRTPENSVGGNLTVSARELSIPRKAHDEMEKGMILLYQKSDYPGSLNRFQRAIKDYPGYYEAYAQMGAAYWKMGDAANSEQSLRKSIEVSKDSYVDGYFMLAAQLTDGKRFEEAASAARKAVELNGNSWEAQFELARALYGLDNLQDAEQSDIAAAKLQADQPEIYLLLANIHGRNRDYARFVEDLSAFLKLDPNGPQADEVRKTRAQVMQKLEREQTGVAQATSAPTP
jgi:tetratricopeptide (TPR) repeat protein